MKSKIIKRILAVLLTVVMLLTAIPISVFAANAEKKTGEIQSEAYAEGATTVGNFLADALQKAQAQSKEKTRYPCSINNLILEGFTATVKYFTKTDAKLIVAIYTEDGKKMLTSGITKVTSEFDTAIVDITKIKLPEYYLIKAFLLNPLDHSALSDVLTDDSHTKAYIDFHSKNIYDFPQERVVNLDSNEDTNFLVVNKSTININGDETTNLLTFADYNTMTFVFENIDSSLKSLEVGNIFLFVGSDCASELIKISKIKVKGTTATIVGSKDLDIDEAFEYIRIDSSAIEDEFETEPTDVLKPQTIIPSSEKTFLKLKFGLELVKVKDKFDESNGLVVPILKMDAIVGNYEKDKALDDKAHNGDKFFTAEFDLNLKAKFEIELSKDYKKVEFAVIGSSKVTLTLEGDAIDKEIPLGNCCITFLKVLNVGSRIKFIFTITGKIEASGILTFSTGFRWVQNYGFNSLSEAPSFKPDLQFQATIYLGIEFETYLNLICEYALEVSLPKVISIEINASLSLSEMLDKDHYCDACIAGDVNITFDADAKLKIANYNDDDLTFSIIDNITFKITDFYYSLTHNEFGLGICPYRKYDNVTDDDKIEEGKCGDNVKYTLYSNGYILINGSGDMYDYKLKESPFYNRSFIKAIKIEDGVTSIGNTVFYKCSGLVTINIGDSVKTIGTNAFEECIKLKSITIPNSVTEIGEKVFYGCKDLHTVDLSQNIAFIGNDTFNGCTSLTNITIPEKVTSIGLYAFKDCENLYSVIIPNKVTNIGQSAFCGCTKLIEITIPISVTRIKNSVFKSCDRLFDVYYLGTEDDWNKIIIEENNECLLEAKINCVKKIKTDSCGDNVKYELYDNGTLVISGSGKMTKYRYLDQSPFYKHTLIKNVIIEYGVTSIEEYTFYGCINLTNITIPDSVTSIGCAAFEDTEYYNNNSNWVDNVLYIGNHLIKSKSNISGSYTITNRTKTIADYAFENCDYLTSITIPCTVTSIGYMAFSNCDILDNITIPKSVMSIGHRAFSECKNLTTVTIDKGVTNTGEDAFYSCTKLKTITIPNTVTRIESGSFSCCSTLASITIPNSVTSIGSGAFSGCDSLTSITIPNSVTRIESSAFSGCDNLINIKIPESVTSIGERAFLGTAYYKDKSNWVDNGLYICNHLVTVKEVSGNYSIMEGTKTISDCAFRYFDKLESITIPDSVTSIGGGAFYCCGKLTNVVLNCSASVTSIGDSAFYCCSIENITIPDSVTSIGDNAFYNCQKLTTIEGGNGVTSIGAYAFFWCLKLNNVTIGNSVTSIGDYAFAGCSSLTNITIGNSVTNIGDHAFDSCGITSITIPNSVTSIGKFAFAACNKLTNITIPDSITSIGECAFCKCTALTSITIPDNVTSIGERVFYECTALTSITIPKSVTSIGYQAFYNCNNLKDVYYSGSQVEWEKISIYSNGNGYLLEAAKHCNQSSPIRSINSINIVPMSISKAETLYTTNANEFTFSYNSCASNGEYILLNITNYSENLQFTNDNLQYIDMVSADENGKLSIIFEPKTFSSDSTTILIGDFGDGIKVIYLSCHHNYCEWKVLTPATTDHDGLEQRICSICGAKETRSIPKLTQIDKVTAVKLNTNSVTTNYNRSFTLSPTVEIIENPDYAITYSTSNSKVATVDQNGNVKTTGKGNAIITVTVTDSNGNVFTDTCNVNVKFTFGQWLLYIICFGWIWM